jgi:hypothetical protein
MGAKAAHPQNSPPRNRAAPQHHLLLLSLEEIMQLKSLLSGFVLATLLFIPFAAQAQVSSFASGPGSNPSPVLSFLATPAPVTIANFNIERIHVVSDKSLGTTVGATDLDLFICFQRQGGNINAVGVGTLDQRIDAGFRQIFGLNAVIQVKKNGNYLVGLCGLSPNFADWDSNDGSYTSALIVN